MNLPDINRDLGPEPTPQQQLRHQPNDQPEWANAFGYCLDCEKRYGSHDWKLNWCGASACQKFHTCCPHCDEALTFHCLVCGKELRGLTGDLRCPKHTTKNEWSFAEAEQQRKQLKKTRKR